MADVQTKSVDRKDSTPKSSAVGTLLQLLPKIPRLSDLKMPDVSPKAMINAMEHSKDYGKLITAIKSNADPEKFDNACEFAVKLSIRYGDRITASNIVDALLYSPEKLSKAIDMPFNKIVEAQTCIADAIQSSILKESRLSHKNINPYTLATLIQPNSDRSLLDKQGNYSTKNLNAVAAEVTNNILNNPKTREEFGMRNYAYQQKEIEHQQLVKNIAHQKIHNEACEKLNHPFFRYFPGLILNMESQAHYVADQWSPGVMWGGQIGSKVTGQMNQGYYSTQGQADDTMRQRVFEEVRSKIHSSFTSLSQEDRDNLTIASRVISHTSNKTYSATGGLRVHDLEQLGSLNTVARGLVGTNNNPPENAPAFTHTPQRRTQHEHHSKGIVQVSDPKEFKWITQNNPDIKSHGIDIREYNVYKYRDTDGTTSYDLMGKSGIGLMSIRNNRLENYILKDVLDRIQNT